MQMIYVSLGIKVICNSGIGNFCTGDPRDA